MLALSNVVHDPDGSGVLHGERPRTDDAVLVFYTLSLYTFITVPCEITFIFHPRVFCPLNLTPASHYLQKICIFAIRRFG